MDLWASILKFFDGRGIAEAGILVALLGGLGFQCSQTHDAEVERDAYKNMYTRSETERLNWKLNAKSWEDAAASCSRGAADMRRAAREVQEDLQRELISARRGRRVSELELVELRRQIEAGEIDVYTLLRRVQAL